MSTNLYWKPVESGKPLCYELKKIFRGIGYFSNYSNSFRLNSNHLEFLQGLKYGSKSEELIVEVNTLIEAINLYDEIEITEE